MILCFPAGTVRRSVLLFWRTSALMSMQKRVEEAYRDKEKWGEDGDAEYSLLGKFSSTGRSSSTSTISGILIQLLLSKAFSPQIFCGIFSSGFPRADILWHIFFRVSAADILWVFSFLSAADILWHIFFSAFRDILWHIFFSASRQNIFRKILQNICGGIREQM